MSERRAIIARRLVQAASAVIPLGSLILLPHEAAEWKKILSGWEENFCCERDVETGRGNLRKWDLVTANGWARSGSYRAAGRRCRHCCV
jgi:hypothetical protein